MSAGSIAARLRAGAGLVGFLALLAGGAAQAAPAPVLHHDPLSPIRAFVAVVPSTPAPLESLSREARRRLDGLTAERPAAPRGLDALRQAAPVGLDALRQAASSPSVPGGR